MKRDFIIDSIKAIKPGCLFRITYKSEIPVKAEFKNNGIRLIKITETTVRTGVAYRNLKSVMATEATSSTEHKKSNFEWVVTNRVSYNSNTDKMYARIATIKNGNNAHHKYIVECNGICEEVDSLNEAQRNFVVNSYWNKHETPSVQNVSLDNILSIGKTVFD